MKRRVVAIIGAVVFALVGTAALAAYVGGAAKRAQAGEKVVDVLVVSKAIPAGTKAADLADKTTLKQVPAKVRADNAVTNLSTLSGKVAAVALVPGEQLVASRFVTPAEYSIVPATVNGSPVSPSLLQVTLALDPERALGGEVGPGNTVAVLASFDETTVDGPPVVVDGVTYPTGSKIPATTRLILHKVVVTSVSLADKPRSQDSSSTTLAPTGKLYVTLAIDAASVQPVVFAAEHGQVWLSGEPASAPQGTTAALTESSLLR